MIAFSHLYKSTNRSIHRVSLSLSLSLSLSTCTVLSRINFVDIKHAFVPRIKTDGGYILEIQVMYHRRRR